MIRASGSQGRSCWGKMPRRAAGAVTAALLLMLCAAPIADAKGRPQSSRPWLFANKSSQSAPAFAGARRITPVVPFFAAGAFVGASAASASAERNRRTRPGCAPRARWRRLEPQPAASSQGITASTRRGNDSFTCSNPSRRALALRPAHRPHPRLTPSQTARPPGSAAYASLSRNPSAICDGNATTCYQDFCERTAASLRGRGDPCFDAAAANASAAAGGPANASAGGAQMLMAAECPGAPYSECYFSENGAFACLGRPRPTANESVDLFCATDAGASAKSATSGVTALQARPGRLAAVAMALAALLAALA